jgi:urea transport system permease protein
MRAVIASALLWIALCVPSFADLQPALQENQADIAKASRKTIESVLETILDSHSPEAPVFLEQWREKNVWMRKSDGLFFFVETDDKKTYRLIDITTGDIVGEAAKRELSQLRPNSGVRSVIAAALVQFQLSDPDINRRLDAMNAIERDPEPSHLKALRGAIDSETDSTIKSRKVQLEQFLTVQFETDENRRLDAINGLAGKLNLQARAALNPILSTTRKAFADAPTDANIASELEVGTDISVDDAYDMLVDNGLAAGRTSIAARKEALIQNIKDGSVGGVSVTELTTQQARDRAYATLAQNDLVPPLVTDAMMAEAVSQHIFLELYTEQSKEVTDAAQATLDTIETKVAVNQTLDLALDGLSLASIYFLAAIGLAITFGVMGVINMAHGEFIMMGAYTGYVVQLFIPDYTLSIIVALPAAFAVTFAAGVAMERLVIRWLYNRPLETLLATFGISIALQQIAKNIFGTQARPLTSPGWLDGAWILNDVVSISYIRIAIFVLGLIFLILLLFILNRTRLGLEVRAVTQNPRMAASMGINPDRINMLTFGLGSGIAGIAGVAIGLYAKVTSELGADYIVQSFMTVVVGGVGNIWGALLGATMIGFLQKGIEWFNPSNTLAAQTYMIVFIIIFIQFRPKGIIALKGRAAGD